MRRAPHIVIALALIAPATPAFAQDAVRAMEKSGFRILSAPAGTRVMTAAEAQQAGVIGAGASAGSALAAGDGATVRTLLEGNFPVPGLGFDYPHLAAVNRNLETRALIDPLTQQRLALARQIRQETPFVPFVPVLFPMPTVVVVQPAPPVIVLQPAASEAAEVPVPRAERVSRTPREPETAVEAPALSPVEPHRELEEYVLVRKDGREIFVVAFSAQNGRLVYVTRDGLRRSVSLAELDGDATARRNEDRGADVRLPI